MGINQETHGLVLSDSPEQQRLRSLRADLEQRRDMIAELDIAIEDLRDRLSSFEQRLEMELAFEHAWLNRVESTAKHLDAWTRLLNRLEPQNVRQHGKKLRKRRQKQVQKHHFEGKADAVSLDAEDTEISDQTFSTDLKQRLKQAFHALAKRFHPDLAQNEEDRLQYGSVMARITTLYRQGDMERLEAMAEQAKGGELDALDLPLEEQFEQLEERLQWFNAVLENLRDEQQWLQQSSTHALLCEIEQAGEENHVLQDLKEDLNQRAAERLSDIAHAAQVLEESVQKYNREKARPNALSKKSGSVSRVYNPFSDKKLVHMSLEALARKKASPEAKKQAIWIENEGAKDPPLLRLFLLGYVSSLSAYPLPGLESFEDLRIRYDYLGQDDKNIVSLESSLVRADTWLEFGVKPTTSHVVRTGLRFRSSETPAAVMIALHERHVREEFKRVLGVLGDAAVCPTCGHQGFLIPVFQTRGIDNFRSNLCKACGHALSKYWMPKGKDIQAVLNAAYLEFDLITEVSLKMSRATIGMQFLPKQMEELRVGDLKQRLFVDLFERYELDVSPKDVRLCHKNKALSDRTPLEKVDSKQFVIRFSKATALSELAALEVLRHRIRTRFQPETGLNAGLGKEAKSKKN